VNPFLEYTKESINKPKFKFLMFRLIISPMGSFDKGREVSFACLSSVGDVIFILQKGIICPEKTLDLIRVKKFMFKLFIRRPV
jgi:hypothetical protein